MKFDRLSNRVIGCALEVHQHLGPGLLESTYEQCLAHELNMQGIPFKTQCALPVEYKGCKLDCGYRIDLFVDDSIVIELKLPIFYHTCNSSCLIYTTHSPRDRTRYRKTS